MPLFGRGGIVTRAMIDRARRDVWRELECAGLSTDALARVRVTRPWLQLNERVGFYVPGREGTIAIPALSLGRLAEYRRQASWTGVRDILRHEYAHALADLHPHTVERASFVATFGGGHDDVDSAGPYGHATHVSEYAATAPAEDFAESVMLYLRCGGRLSGFDRRPGVLRKLRFVSQLPRWLHGEEQPAAEMLQTG